MKAPPSDNPLYTPEVRAWLQDRGRRGGLVGGKAGKGAAKVRGDTAYYAKLGRAAMRARWGGAAGKAARKAERKARKAAALDAERLQAPAPLPDAVRLQADAVITKPAEKRALGILERQEMERKQ